VARENHQHQAICFRCDGTAQTGLGHLSRCLALAEAFKERGLDSRFFGKFGAGGTEMLARAGVQFDCGAAPTGGAEDLNDTLRYIKNCTVRGVVLDSYLADEAYLEALSRSGRPVLVIDDFNRLHRYACAAVLNFTVAARQLNYPVGNQLYLLGPEYLLVRQKLRRQRRRFAGHNDDVRRVLVAMGGVDSHDSTSYLVKLLSYLARNLSLHVIVGRDYTYQSRLRSLLNGFRQASVATQLTDLADEFAWADLCFCGGGLTKYESAYMGIPAAVMSQNSEQAKETIQFADKGLAFNLGIHGECAEDVLAERISLLLRDRSLRKSLSEAGLTVFPEDPTGTAAAAFGRILQ